MVEFNPFRWETHEDPYPVYRRLRDEAPAYRNDELGFWALSRHEDVLAGFRDFRRFSNKMGVALEAMSPDASETMSFLGMDPPRHGRLRGLVSAGFTPRRVRDLEPRIREIATGHIDRFIESGSCDFITEFAGKLPMDVISEMLGVPTEDRDDLRRWADLVVHREQGDQSVPPAAVESSGKILSYFVEDIEERRKSAKGETLTDALIRAAIDGDSLTDREILGFLFLMIIAGNETTTKLLGNATYWLHECPDQRRKVQEDHAKVSGWVEETLRYDASSQILYRTLTEDVEMHGKVMREGEYVALIVGSANRDERVFDDPDTYDVERDNRNSLAFGQGTHFCMGASLARLEGVVSLEEITRRLPDFEVDRNGLERVHSGNVRGYSAMPMQFTPGKRST